MNDLKSKAYKSTKVAIASGKNLHLYTDLELKEKLLLSPIDFYIISIKNSIIYNLLRGIYVSVLITLARFIYNIPLFLNFKILIINLTITFVIIQIILFLLQIQLLLIPKILISLLSIKDGYKDTVLNCFYYLKGFLHNKQKSIFYKLFFWPFIPYENVYLLPKELLAKYINRDCRTIYQNYVGGDFFLMLKWYLVIGFLPLFFNIILLFLLFFFLTTAMLI